VKTTLFSSLFIALANLAYCQATTFNYTGGVQTYTVPVCATSILVDVRGAQGGTVTNLTIAPKTAAGGNGGRVQANIPVAGGTVLHIFVGGVGQSDGLTLSCQISAGGFNGGAPGYGGYNSYNYNMGGGGGASDIRIPPYAYANVLVVGGGGGGAACTGCTGAAVAGGAGGGLIGGNGAGGACCAGTDDGLGGTQVAGGAAGTFWGAGTAGASATGGTSLTCCPVTCGGGGGGGGGYFGGGGGSLAAGGGGSSYTVPAATGVVHTQGFQAGNGQIIITPNCALPVKFLYFNANYEQLNSIVKLDWATGTETNNKLFTLEKSVDAQDWNIVATLPGAGNSSQNLYYTAIDENPYPGVSYYRVKQTDDDGNVTYSENVSVTIAANYAVNLFPNPTKGDMTLSYSSQSPDPIKITITDISGRIVTSYFIEEVQSGINNFKVNTSTLPRGMYFMIVSNPQKTFNIKFVKE